MKRIWVSTHDSVVTWMKRRLSRQYLVRFTLLSFIFIWVYRVLLLVNSINKFLLFLFLHLSSYTFPLVWFSQFLRFPQFECNFFLLKYHTFVLYILISHALPLAVVDRISSSGELLSRTSATNSDMSWKKRKKEMLFKTVSTSPKQFSTYLK